MNESTLFQGITVYISGDPDKKVYFCSKKNMSVFALCLSIKTVVKRSLNHKILSK